jgi:uncharacterized radical SAM superfamily Fe-S cluster-containing enzyme
VSKPLKVLNEEAEEVEQKLIHETTSLCPECLMVLKARIYEENNRIMMSKTCPEHGEFVDVYWSDAEMYYKAKKYDRSKRGLETFNTKVEKGCPFDCGLCDAHESHTALANIVVTNRCNLNCWYCFFYADKAGYVYDPSLEQIRKMMRSVRSEKPVACNALQLTGGEPTMRDDLVDIVRMAKEEGFEHVQLNTNGIKIGEDFELFKKLNDAGVGVLYLSFDGVSQKTNPKNYKAIPKIFENARKTKNINIVLVPTVIGGVNDFEVGDILDFGFKNNDIVKGINYQPVSLVGMMPRNERERMRITIPDVIKKIEEYTNGEVGRNDFYPIPYTGVFSDFIEGLSGKPQYDLNAHFACGMGTYVFRDEGKIIPITRFVDVDGLGEFLRENNDSSGRVNRFLFSTKLLYKLRGFIDNSKKPRWLDIYRLLFDTLVKHDYSSLGRLHNNSLFIGMMHFMDLYNYDIERVEKCVIHYATPDDKIVPFCAFNVLPGLYRDKSQKMFSTPLPSKPEVKETE